MIDMGYKNSVNFQSQIEQYMKWTKQLIIFIVCYSTDGHFFILPNHYQQKFLSLLLETRSRLRKLIKTVFKRNP